jgi:hypothetical protein
MAATQTSLFARHHILPEGFDHEVLSPDRESSSRAICAASFQRIRVPGLSGQETQSQKNGRWGHQIKKIVTQPWQFELWMTRRRKIENLSPDDPRFAGQHGLPMLSLADTYPIPLRVRPVS